MANPVAGPRGRNLLLSALVLALLLGLPVVVWLDLHDISRMSLGRQAADIDSLLTKVRIYYSENVAGRVMAQPGSVAIVHNYREVPGAIPVPATLSIELAHTVTDEYSNMSSRFVSDHPFASRTRHELDPLETRALESFRAHRETIVTEMGWTALTDHVRRISPIVMRGPCVDCHNAHPLSTKRDWRVGDVRGIQEVSIMQPIATNLWSFKHLLAYFVAMAAAGAGFIALQRSQARAIAGANRELDTANRRMQQELAAAAQVQEAMLPTALPNTPYATFAWLFKPCAHVAGDTLNIFHLDDDHVGMYVLDVVGHGPAAAMLAVSVARVVTPGPNSFLIRPDGQGGRRVLTPAEVAKRLDERFPFDSGAEQFFSLLYAVLDLRTRELRYVSAGHPMPILVPADAESPSVLSGDGGPPIGLGTESFPENVVTLRQGERVYLYSDGIPEAMNAGHALFGMSRVLDALGAARAVTLDSSVLALWRAVEAWSAGAPLEDDATLVALQIQ